MIQSESNSISKMLKDNLLSAMRMHKVNSQMERITKDKIIMY